MSQKKLSNLLKGITLLLGVIGAVIYLCIIPRIGLDWSQIEGAEHFFWPWLIFLSITAIPCYIALYKFWKICGAIGSDNSFCEENATRLKDISILLIVDVVYYFLGNVILLLLNMNHPGIMLVSLGIDVVGIAIAVAAAMLSRLVLKAAVIKDENDLTI